MAELLLKAVSASSGDAKKDSLLYKQGDVVTVQPDGHVWGRQETLPTFWIVKAPGVAVEDVLPALAPGDGVRRKQTFDRTTLPTGVRTTLLSVGVVTISRGQLTAALKGKA